MILESTTYPGTTRLYLSGDAGEAANVERPDQAEIKAADEARRGKVAAASRAGASYNLALQDANKGVVCRFLPEPSYVHFALLS